MLFQGLPPRSIWVNVAVTREKLFLKVLHHVDYCISCAGLMLDMELLPNLQFLLSFPGEDPVWQPTVTPRVHHIVPKSQPPPGSPQN